MKREVTPRPRASLVRAASSLWRLHNSRGILVYLRAMVDQMRTCRRTACRWPAMASLAFRYETRQVWLTDLISPPHPAVWDLCPHHADTLTVPRGWERVDERTTVAAPIEPAGRDLVRAEPETTAAREAVLAMVGGGAPQAVSSTMGQVSPPDRYAALRACLPRLAAELADQGELPAGGTSAPVGRAQPAPAVADPPLPPLVELPGQLRLPLEAMQSGVVVSIATASTRRRSES